MVCRTASRAESRGFDTKLASEVLDNNVRNLILYLP